MKTKQRFIDRIWKKIYREKKTCKCHTCECVENNWLVIHDELHADYLFYCEGDMWYEYFDKPLIKKSLQNPQ